MQETNKKASFDKIKALCVVAAITGTVWILGAAGEMDYNDAKTFENQNLGYKKNDIKDTNTLLHALFGASLLCGGALVYKIRDNQIQKTR